DYLHLSAKGYGIWAESIEPRLASILGDTPVRADAGGAARDRGRLERYDAAGKMAYHRRGDRPMRPSARSARAKKAGAGALFVNGSMGAFALLTDAAQEERVRIA